MSDDQKKPSLNEEIDLEDTFDEQKRKVDTWEEQQKDGREKRESGGDG